MASRYNTHTWMMLGFFSATRVIALRLEDLQSRVQLKGHGQHCLTAMVNTTNVIYVTLL